jgi:hypothetical protein
MDDYLYEKVLNDDAAFNPHRPNQVHSSGSRSIRFIEIRKGDVSPRPGALQESSILLTSQLTYPKSQFLGFETSMMNPR